MLEKDQNFKECTQNFISFLGIDNISIDKHPYKEVTFKRFEGEEKHRYEVEHKEDLSILTWYKKFDKNNKVIQDISFNFNRQESEGTKKLVNLLGPFYDVLKNGKVIIIDELDSRLHTLLTLRLIELFHLANKSNAQLIFVSHDTNLLKREVFRRDQIWFAEKNKFGATDLYSLVEYKVNKARNDSSFNKNYLEGKYGAIPYFGDINELLDLIYE